MPGALASEEVEPEIIVPNRPRPFDQITQVSEPALAVYLPETQHSSKISVLVVPGGGLQRLAIEHEGHEVAAWLNQRGITAFVLKYRVPGPVEWGISDAQRSMRWIRSHARHYNIDPTNVGMVGFSAGGEIGAWMAALGSEANYEPSDAIDYFNPAPDFFGLIYPGGLLEWRSRELKKELSDKFTSLKQPVFIAHAMDDSFQNSHELLSKLAAIKAPVELHLYQSGGHGFGVRESAFTAARWSQDWLDSLESQGFLRAYSAKKYGSDFANALPKNGDLIPFSSYSDVQNLQLAYEAQRSFVDAWTKSTSDRIGGFKGAAASQAAQESMGLPGPMTGALFRSGWINAKPDLKLPRLDPDPCVVETEIGYFFGTDVGYEILNEKQMQTVVEWMAPVIELPASYSARMSGKGYLDTIASNIGSHRYIVGQRLPVGNLVPDDIKIELIHNGELQHATQGSAAHRGQWGNLLKVVNQTIRQGHTIQRGQVIICGALGPIRAAKVGKYTANYGELGEIQFEITE